MYQNDEEHSMLTLVQDTRSHEGTLFPYGPYKTADQHQPPPEHICFRAHLFQSTVLSGACGHEVTF